MSAHVISQRREGETDSFRACLQRELARRCNRNPRYSLRAFANYLETDHASLSQLLRGKRPFTALTIRRLGTRIGLGASEIDQYIELQATTAPTASGEVRDLAEEAAEVFANWHAFAILELMRLKEFRPDVSWISRVLGVEGSEINIALQHLLRLGFLKFAAPNQWLDLTGGAVHHEHDFTVLALERLAKRTHSLQLASARNAPGAQRMHGAVTLAVDAQQLIRLLSLAERFMTEVRQSVSPAAGESEAAGQGDRLYHVEVHCFPISTDPS